MRKSSGTIEFHTNQGGMELYIRTGSILSCEGGYDAVNTVKAMLTLPVHNSCIKGLNPEKDYFIAMPLAEIILKACYQKEMNEIRFLELSKYFSSFPPVTIRLVPLHTLGVHFTAPSKYLQLHGQSVLHGSVSLKEHLDKADTSQASREMVLLFTLLYILGLIIPATTKTINKPAKETDSKENVFGRLMKRIRRI